MNKRRERRGGKFDYYNQLSEYPRNLNQNKEVEEVKTVQTDIEPGTK